MPTIDQGENKEQKGEKDSTNRERSSLPIRFQAAKNRVTGIANHLEGVFRHLQGRSSIDLSGEQQELTTKLTELSSLTATTERTLSAPDEKYQQAVKEYITRERYGQPGLGSGDSVEIPTVNGPVKYEVKEFGWTTDRDQGMYDTLLFSDEYTSSHPDTTKPLVFSRRENPTLVAGGKEQAFAAGKKVLDLGSGEALALHEYSQAFPDTTFLGVDYGYEKPITLDLTKPGVQLSKDDWTSLSTIPDNSMDTIISAQGAFVWGVGAANEDGSEEKVLTAVTRVAKPGAILRYDVFSQDHHKKGNERVNNKLREIGWDITEVPLGVVAVKQ